MPVAAMAIGLAVAVAAGFALLGGQRTTPDAPSSVAGAPTGTGHLAVAVSPWGEVFVDGQSAGVSPPLTELTLAAGKHQLQIRNGDLPPLRQDVDIRDGETLRIKHKF